MAWDGFDPLTDDMPSRIIDEDEEAEAEARWKSSDFVGNHICSDYQESNKKAVLEEIISAHTYDFLSQIRHICDLIRPYCAPVSS